MLILLNYKLVMRSTTILRNCYPCKSSVVFVVVLSMGSDAIELVGSAIIVTRTAPTVECYTDFEPIIGDVVWRSNHST